MVSRPPRLTMVLLPVLILDAGGLDVNYRRAFHRATKFLPDLGQRASETLVKSLDLTPYRIISFATHGLVPGDLNGLDQPALALSSPEVTGEDNDGLLTMGEIMGLL